MAHYHLFELAAAALRLLGGLTLRLGIGNVHQTSPRRLQSSEIDQER
jgi:hypothetical protein